MRSSAATVRPESLVGARLTRKALVQNGQDTLSAEARRGSAEANRGSQTGLQFWFVVAHDSFYSVPQMPDVEVDH